MVRIDDQFTADKGGTRKWLMLLAIALPFTDARGFFSLCGPCGM